MRPESSKPYPEKRRYVLPGGYLTVYVPGRGLQLEHRLVMESVLGRPLEPNEHIHHLDHNPQNNDPSNLKLMSPAEHGRLHADTITEEELVNALHEMARRTGRTPQLLDCDRFPDLPSRRPFQRHFGTWKNALTAAGIPPAWSAKHNSCIECGSREFRHQGHGLCCRCYLRHYRESRRAG